MKLSLMIVALVTITLIHSGAAYPLHHDQVERDLEGLVPTQSYLECSFDTRSMHFNNNNIHFRLCTHTYLSSYWDEWSHSWVTQEQKQHCVKPESTIDTCQTNYRQKCKSANWANLFVTFTVCQDGLSDKICYTTNYGECPNLDVKNHYGIEEKCFCQQTDNNGIHCKPQGCQCDQQLTDVLKQVLESEEDCFCKQTDNGEIQCTPKGCQYGRQSMNANKQQDYEDYGGEDYGGEDYGGNGPEGDGDEGDGHEGDGHEGDGHEGEDYQDPQHEESDSGYHIDDSALIPGKMLFGDMILTQNQVIAMMLGYSNEIAGMELWVKDPVKKWPNGRIPYEKDSSLTQELSHVVDNAIMEYHKNFHGCLEFVKHTTEKDYVVFKKGDTCSADLGHHGGVQHVILANAHDCDKEATMHEIMHALGRAHEHQRWDRDMYVTVNWDNIKHGTNNPDFTIFPRSKYDDLGMKYDLHSIMHYPKWADAINQDHPVMTPKPFTGVSVDDMGSPKPKGTFSAGDIQHIKKFYNC